MLIPMNRLVANSLLCLFLFAMSAPGSAQTGGGDIGIIKMRDFFHVVEVRENSPADRAGIKSGSWIESIDGKSTNDFPLHAMTTKDVALYAELYALLRGNVGSSVTIEFCVDDGSHYCRSSRKVSLTREFYAPPKFRIKDYEVGVPITKYKDRGSCEKPEEVKVGSDVRGVCSFRDTMFQRDFVGFMFSRNGQVVAIAFELQGSNVTDLPGFANQIVNAINERRGDRPQTTIKTDEPQDLWNYINGGKKEAQFQCTQRERTGFGSCENVARHNFADFAKRACGACQRFNVYDFVWSGEGQTASVHAVVPEEKSRELQRPFYQFWVVLGMTLDEVNALLWKMSLDNQAAEAAKAQTQRKANDAARRRDF